MSTTHALVKTQNHQTAPWLVDGQVGDASLHCEAFLPWQTTVVNKDCFLIASLDKPQTKIHKYKARLDKLRRCLDLDFPTGVTSLMKAVRELHYLQVCCCHSSERRAAVTTRRPLWSVWACSTSSQNEGVSLQRHGAFILYCTLYFL